MNGVLKMKKFWRISQTDIVGETKEGLKPERNRLNQIALGLKADEKLSDTPSNKWPHRITKGPEHPNKQG
jgi:hypothetical protein